MEKWLSKLSERKNVAIVLYARFPSEMAYGNHVIQVAKGFVKNNCNVNIYYPKTYNSKTLLQTPEEFYGKYENINFIEIDNVDITSFKAYALLPDFIKKFFYSLNTFIWSSKLRNNNNENYVWSTNPNILLIVKKYFQNVIYEKHGRAKYIQNFSISRLKAKNVLMVGVTKQATYDLSKNFSNVIYLPNGVDLDLFNNNSNKINQNITVGYIGMLETYGVDKGVLDALREIERLSAGFEIEVIICGGPKYKIAELQDFVKSSSKPERYSIGSTIPHKQVPEILQTFDIGIVPYPNENHMNRYASPMKIFEMAACGIPILLSDIEAHKELEQFNLGLVYYDSENFNDFSNKLENLLLDSSLRSTLSEKSLKNIHNLSWKKRMDNILTSARSSTG